MHFFEVLKISPTELLVFITGAICVWLLVKENIWNWPAAIANQILCIVLFYRSSLYGDAGLQFVFIAVSVYGWWNWLHGGQNHSELHVGRTDSAGLCGYGLITAVLTAVIYFVLRRFTPSNVPFSDGLTTAMSLTALYMQTRKLIENWWLWIAADVFYIFLYCYKGLYLTAFLYLIFMVMCIAGLREWERTFRERQISGSAAKTSTQTVSA